MDYYFEVCDKCIKPKSKYKYFQLDTHKEFEECKHMESSIENLYINDVDSTFYTYII